MDLAKQEQIQKYFDGLYRRGFKPWTEHGREPLLEKFFKTLSKNNPQAKLLDLGCGDGWISLRAAAKGFEVWGIDSSATAISEAKMAAAETKLSAKAHFQAGDALALPYADDFFDGMIDRGLFHHIIPENRERYLEQITSVLKTGALVHLSVFGTRNPAGIGQLFSRELIIRIFGGGFKILEFEEDPYPTEAPAHLLHFILSRR